MAIRLEIKNNNTSPVDIKVYRSTTEINRQSLPAPLLTLTQVTGTPVVVNDPTAVQDAFYYYVFEVIGPKDSQTSRNFYLQATETRGEGKSKILVGDANLGFMDILTPDTFITSADLLTAVGAGALTTQVPITQWVKYIRKNKIYFVPNLPLIRSTTFGLLSAAKLDTNLPVVIRGKNYILRMPTVYDENTSDLLTQSGLVDMDTMLARTSEFNDFMYPLINFTPLGQKLPNIINQTYNTLYLATTGSTFIISREKTSSGSVTTRGSNSNTRAAITAAQGQGPSSQGSYWPILELVEG